MLEDFDLYELNKMVRLYDFKNNKNLMIGAENPFRDSNKRNKDIDFVIYDVEDMLEVPDDIEEFYSIVEENALDIESFEINRFTFLDKSSFS